jgi:hypothetical protein
LHASSLLLPLEAAKHASSSALEIKVTSAKILFNGRLGHDRGALARRSGIATSALRFHPQRGDR